MSSLDHGCDECWPEHDLERSMGSCDSVFWFEALVRWFTSAPIG
ncbi:MAG TPA: hypothetical protein VM686_22365 [Polyangiaceae bacterium]|nr:hypothetical protein [Polyangiaceae bacterium]